MSQGKKKTFIDYIQKNFANHIMAFFNSKEAKEVYNQQQGQIKCLQEMNTNKYNQIVELKEYVSDVVEKLNGKQVPESDASLLERGIKLSD